MSRLISDSEDLLQIKLPSLLKKLMIKVLNYLMFVDLIAAKIPYMVLRPHLQNYLHMVRIYASATSPSPLALAVKKR